MQFGRHGETNAKIPKFISILAIFIFITMFYFVYINSVYENGSLRYNFPSPKQRKTILVWTPFFSNQDWIPSTTTLQCQYQDCDITYNKSLYSTSSAVIFHLRDVNLETLPSFSERPNCSMWVLFNMEAPPHTPVHTLEALEGRIHWMVTYRRDSEFHAPYGEILATPERNYSQPDILGKNHLVCWMVSNCQTPGNREDFVKQLQQHIGVDIYGKCGPKKCFKQTRLDCYHWLGDHCYFYLSFENSICKDYATEKLFNALSSDMVPVVFGGENYAAYLPEHSFIDALKFANPRDLGDYLKNLSHNRQQYLAYFRWKKYRSVSSHMPYKWYCDLCEKLHTTDTCKVQPRTNISNWWYDGAKCKKWAD